jgi:hypothetical protein
MGPPSKTVATDAGVPGIFKRIAEIKPPEMPPIYNPINREIPLIADIPKDNGRNRHTAITADKPGMEPKMMPMNTPAQINRRQVGEERTDITPFIIIVNSPHLSQNAGREHIVQNMNEKKITDHRKCD